MFVPLMDFCMGLLFIGLQIVCHILDCILCAILRGPLLDIQVHLPWFWSILCIKQTSCHSLDIYPPYPVDIIGVSIVSMYLVYRNIDVSPDFPGGLVSELIWVNIS